MAIKHPPRDVLAAVLIAARTAAGPSPCVDQIVALYDQANPDDPAVRVANEVGTMYKQLRGMGIADKDAMTLIEMALRSGALMRVAVSDKLAEHVASFFKPFADKLAPPPPPEEGA